MDELDLKIIIALQEDVRIANTELSRKLGIPESTIRRRVQRLLTDHVIKVTALPNPFKVGYRTMILIGLQVKVSKLYIVADRLAKCQNVRLVALATGRFNIIAWALFESVEEFERFVRSELALIPGINQFETMVQLELKKQTPGHIPVFEDKVS